MAETISERRRDREVVGQAFASAAVIATVIAALWFAAPVLEGLDFWEEHFPWAHPREPLPFLGGFLLAGVLAAALWPGTWEAVLLERSLRALGWTILLYWLLAVVLEAPAMAGLAVLPILAGPAFTTFMVARRGPPGAVRPYIAALLSVAGALALILLAVVPFDWLTRFVLLPLPVALYAVGPTFVLREVRDREEARARRARPSADRPREGSDLFVDLPAGTLRPAASGLGVLATIASVVFLVTVLAPGIPLSGPIAWVALTLSLPTVIWTVLRRDGVAHPRRILAPLHATRHAARVQHVRDEDLERLDDALLRFIRSGRGRSDLASALAGVLSASVAQADRDHLDALLARLPRAPWRRRVREEGIAHLLGGTAILQQAREGGRP